MKLAVNTLLALLFGTMAVSCVNEISPDEEEIQEFALKAWILKHRDDLKENLQTNGKYYVDVKEWGDLITLADDNDFGGAPIMDQDTCWMYYEFTGYDLDGNVCITRNSDIARLQGTYTKYTHYVPYLNYCGDSNVNGLQEGTYMATRNALLLGEQYVKSNPQCKGTEMKVRKDSKLWIYMPATISSGSDSNNGDGGYEGQFTLSTSVPMIMEMRVCRVVKNPSKVEIAMADTLAYIGNQLSAAKNWLKVEKIVEEEELSSRRTMTTRADEEETEYYDGLYYNLMYNPKDWAQKFSYARPDMVTPGRQAAYVDKGIYTNMDDIEKKISDILLEKFGDEAITPEEFTEENLIGTDQTAKVWYVARFLDGFVLDTNIPEIKEAIWGEKDQVGVAISYNAENNETDYITAWYHCIPLMHFGQWGAIITTSGFAYGSSGVSGSSSSSSSSTSYNYSYDDYYQYAQYYSSYINPYGYYDYSNYYGSTSSNIDTSSINTEIQGYTPLVMYLFIEPQTTSTDD